MKAPPSQKQLKADLWRRSIQRRRGIFEDPNSPQQVQDPDQEKAYLYSQGPGVQAEVVLPEEQISRMQMAGQGLQGPYKNQINQVQSIGQSALKSAIARRAYADEDRRRKEEAEKLYQSRVSQLNAQALSNQIQSNYQADPNSPWQLPLQNYTVTARYGQTGRMWKTTHGGLDLAAPTGTPIRPVRPGTVTKVEFHPAFGNVVWVDNGNGITTRYGHMSKFGEFRAGQNVGMNDILGYVGQTGNASGPHLHLGFYNSQGQTMNPEDYIGYLLR